MNFSATGEGVRSRMRRTGAQPGDVVVQADQFAARQFRSHHLPAGRKERVAVPGHLLGGVDRIHLDGRRKALA
jgi:hypothetical protein